MVSVVLLDVPYDLCLWKVPFVLINGVNGLATSQPTLKVNLRSAVFGLCLTLYQHLLWLLA